MVNVLVVGGAGYIGGAVTDALHVAGISFSVFDNLLYEPHYLKPVDFIFGDVRDTALLKQILPRYTHVIWLAAIVGDGACEIEPELTTAVNAKAVRWLSYNFHGRVVFTSTCSVYGHNYDEVDESAALHPLSHYAKTKLYAESILKPDNSLIFRLGTAFGISDTYSRPRMDLVANQMAVAALSKGALTVHGGQQWRPFIHVKDIARAIVFNLSRPVRGVYNLATHNLQISELAEQVRAATNCRIVYGELSKDNRDYRANVDKALRDEIFSPSTAYTIGDGVREFAALVKSGRVKHTESDTYFNVRELGRLKNHGKFV